MFISSILNLNKISCFANKVREIKYTMKKF